MRYKEAFGAACKELRERNNMSQDELGRLVGVTRSAISRVETEGMGGEDLRRSLAEVFGVPYNSMLVLGEAILAGSQEAAAFPTAIPPWMQALGREVAGLPPKHQKTMEFALKAMIQHAKEGKNSGPPLKPLGRSKRETS